ncbi:L-threonylcarbamoyladenylate synthase type 1 TsaC [Colwellia sp. Arc7-635]|uniref:Sua5/YciO/YrdC/YwlC family protein n=1 Tax=Colwellia sp. Arc7-635 TaxID=2497879 RepID=UPI000F850B64|nr:Sua5/YciO/YrdC/YwlC family protein [Colwellia sp. Arc7-635]AZQ82619.1 L-threonylcarbamoyladenylate synthase type 1 TsaC [Colwellia sp. Arc7-635]
MTTALETFQQGGILAYPTEAVFGLGCDPDNDEAINKLLSIKSRPADKGLILLAGNYSQLLPYIDDSKIPQDKRFTVLSRWPDGITQLVAKNVNTSALLSGRFDTIAVRVTSQPDVVALCNASNKPIVSTSANLSGEIPAKTWQEIPNNLIEKIDFIIKGQTLGFDQPSTIIDALSGDIIRS